MEGSIFSNWTVLQNELRSRTVPHFCFVSGALPKRIRGLNGVSVFYTMFLPLFFASAKAWLILAPQNRCEAMKRSFCVAENNLTTVPSSNFLLRGNGAANKIDVRKEEAAV